jgi:hypothetical protein
MTMNVLKKYLFLFFMGFFIISGCQKPEVEEKWMVERAMILGYLLVLDLNEEASVTVTLFYGAGKVGNAKKYVLSAK